MAAMTRHLVLLLAAGLAACATTPDGPRGRWALQTSATAGSALIVEDGQGEALRIACRRNPADLFVTSGRLNGADGPVALHVGEQIFPLGPPAEGPALTATAPIPPGLAAALMSGGVVSLDQADRRLGPYPTPDSKTVAAFAIACRSPG